MRAIVRSAFPAECTAVAQARRFVRQTLVAWGAEDVIDDAILLTSELATNAVTHAETPFEVICAADDGSVRVEIVDRDPARALPAPRRGGDLHRISGRGLLMPVMLAESWGVSYAADTKTVWFRLPSRLMAIRPAVRSGDRLHQSWPSFLAEAGALLAGTLDEAMLVALAAQIVVPRLAHWCAFYRADDVGSAELTHVWHADERRIGTLRGLLAKAAPPPADGGVRPWAGLGGFPDERLRELGACVAMPLRARWRSLGTLVLGRIEGGLLSQEVAWMVEDLGHRIALGLDNARMYSREQAVSQTLQRSLLPYAVPDIPGVEHSVVYEPAGEGHDVGGDFYDVFEAGPDRWRFAIGDVCGTGPEAAAVTGLARHVLRLLAGEGYGVADVLKRLNQAILDEGDRGRLMTLLHGELVRRPDGGVRLTLVSAGHPLPLRLSPSGKVVPAARGQLLLGVIGDATFAEESVDLDPGDVLLCVTDGVTERRSGGRLFDDDDRLARLLAGWTDLSAGAVAERLRQAVGAYAAEPSSDDMAILVLRVDAP